jgi:transcriptional regulator with XRE-family HTH domain
MKRQKGFLANRLSMALAIFRGGESQNKFAKRLGVSNATLNRIENQVQNVSLETLEKLCLALRCDITDLFPPDDRGSRPEEDRPGRQRGR